MSLLNQVSSVCFLSSDIGSFLSAPGTFQFRASVGASTRLVRRRPELATACDLEGELLTGYLLRMESLQIVIGNRTKISKQSHKRQHFAKSQIKTGGSLGNALASIYSSLGRAVPSCVMSHDKLSSSECLMTVGLEE